MKIKTLKNHEKKNIEILIKTKNHIKNPTERQIKEKKTKDSPKHKY